MKPHELEKFGLTEGESKVYLGLLKTGKSTVGHIVRESKVSSSKIYEILERLIKKGIVGRVTENNKKYFEAKDPNRLKDFIQQEESRLSEKKIELDQIMPSLKEMYDKSEVEDGAEILQGFKGLMSWHEKILDECKKGETILIMAPTKANEQMDAHLLEWHAKRIKRGISCKLLYNNDADKWAKSRKNLELTEIRFLPENIQSPVALNITEISVANTVFGNNIVTFIVKSPEVSEHYKTYFNLLWKISKSKKF